jgi:hypothetical protein
MRSDLGIALPESPPWWSLFDAGLDDMLTVIYIYICI